MARRRPAVSTVIRLQQQRIPRWQAGTAVAAAACLLLGISIYRSETNDALSLPGDVVRPDLKPWGLHFASGGRLASDGKPGFAFTYTTDNKELGSVMLLVTNSSEPDIQPTFDPREGVNALYWRHHGHGYYIIGGANQGWIWNLQKDIAYQLKAM